MDKWLESLQKAHKTTASSVKPALNVDAAFRDLVKVSDGEDVPVVSASRLYDSDPETSFVYDPVAAFVQKAHHDTFSIPDITPPHEDGTFFEKCGSATWTHTYRNGVLAESVVRDPNMPDGGMAFDGHGNEISKNLRVSWPGATRPIELFPTVNGGIPVRYDLDLLDASWEELLGSSAYPEKRPELYDDSKTKKVTNGAPLAKAEITSRMVSLLSQIRGDCIGNEESLLEKALAALDISAFTQITTSIIERLKKRAA